MASTATTSNGDVSAGLSKFLRNLWAYVEVNRSAQFAVLLFFTVAIRCPAFGEWNYSIDDQFYALTGLRLLNGDLLYVDIWDRKGPALYLAFAAIGLVCRSVIAYQLVAALSVALGAYGVNRIARRISTPQSALISAAAYAALLSRFEGDNAEAGVFFNSLVIASVSLLSARINVLRQGKIDARLTLGFFCLGVAIAFKQTIAFEGLTFGLLAVGLLWRSNEISLFQLAKSAGVLAVAGALPMVATGIFYAWNGHFPELWNAMVTSNFSRGYADTDIRLTRMVVMLGMLAIPLLFAGIGTATMLKDAQADEATIRIVLVWAAIALIVIFAFPNIYVHYAQSVLAPLSILCAGYFAHKRPIWPGIVALIGVSLILSGTFHLGDRWRARPAAAAMVDYVRQETPSRRLLVWGAPNYLYALVDAKPPSVLAFAPHLYEGREWTGIDEVAQVRGIVALAPETVVAQTPLPSSPLNLRTVALVNQYLRTCLRHRSFVIFDHNGPQNQVVYSHCGAVGGTAAG